MAEVSRQVLASLLVLLIMVSIVGTWSVLSYVSSLPAPAAPLQHPSTQGKVSLNVNGPIEPSETGGMVTVRVP